MAVIGKSITNFVKLSKQHGYFYLGLVSFISLLLLNQRFQQDYRLHQVKSGPETCTQRIYDLYALAGGENLPLPSSYSPYIAKTKECVLEMLLTFDELMDQEGPKTNKAQILELRNQLSIYSKTLQDFLQKLQVPSGTQEKVGTTVQSQFSSTILEITKSFDVLHQNFSLIRQKNFFYFPIYLGVIFAGLFLLVFFHYLTKKSNLRLKNLITQTEDNSKAIFENMEQSSNTAIEDYLKKVLGQFSLFYTHQLFSQWSKRHHISSQFTPTNSENSDKNKLRDLFVGNKSQMKQRIAPSSKVTP